MPYVYCVAMALYDEKTDKFTVLNVALKSEEKISDETAERVAKNKIYGEITEWDMKNGSDWEIVGCCVADLNHLEVEVEVDEEELNAEYARAEKWKMIAGISFFAAVLFAACFIGLACFLAGVSRHG